MTRNIFILFLILLAFNSMAQQRPAPKTLPDADILADTAIDYDELLNDLDAFIDFLLQPKSYLLINVSAGSGNFNYPNKQGTKITREKQLVLTPTLGYYHKSGAGLALAGNFVNEKDKGFAFYQAAVTASYDYLKDQRFVSGISYSRFFNKDSLDFYITPLINEINGYFTWRDTWLQPGISANVGWGTRTEVSRDKKYLKLLRLRRRGLVTSTETEESILDFTVTASARHNFYWLNFAGTKGYLKLTPMLSLSAGTQKYGFNSSVYYSFNGASGNNPIFNTGEMNLDAAGKFEPQSLTLQVRPEYVLNKFYVQPQFIFDYYLPESDDNFTFIYGLNVGFMF